jgi:hypothetical protein
MLPTAAALVIVTFPLAYIHALLATAAFNFAASFLATVVIVAVLVTASCAAAPVSIHALRATAMLIIASRNTTRHSALSLSPRRAFKRQEIR